ncbi:MAG: chemotaxis protein CheX [Bryobacteraceae bacterium]
MEASEIGTVLTSAVEEILETMCFTPVLSSAEGDPPPDVEASGPKLCAEVQFHGSPSGGFRVGVPKKLAQAVGAAFLGQEETEVSDSQAEEVVCELTNMICGSVLSRLESKTIFKITHPELIPVTGKIGFDAAAADRWFDLGDGALNVSLIFQ